MQQTKAWRCTRCASWQRGFNFSQKEGIEYEETFAVVARYSSILTIISLAAEMGWRVHQMDVKTAFLNGVIGEEVFI